MGARRNLGAIDTLQAVPRSTVSTKSGGSAVVSLPVASTADAASVVAALDWAAVRAGSSAGVAEVVPTAESLPTAEYSALAAAEAYSGDNIVVRDSVLCSSWNSRPDLNTEMQSYRACVEAERAAGQVYWASDPALYHVADTLAGSHSVSDYWLT